MEVTNEIIRKRVVADIFRCSEDDSIFNEEDDTVDEDTVRNENSMNADIEEVSSMDDGLHIFYQGDDEDVKGIDMSETTMNEGMFMRGHRKLTLNMKRVLEANDICGIRPSKSIRMLEVEVGGLENLSCLAKDCRNFIENKRRLQLGVEKVKVMERSILNDWYVKEFVYEGDLTIRDPKIITSRGRPRENRYKSSGEKKRKVLLVEAEAMEATEEKGVEDEDQTIARIAILISTHGIENSYIELSKNETHELASRDQPPSVGMYYASIDILFDAYLSYAREKGFSVAKKPASKGNGNVHKYQTISCDRGRKSYAKSISKRINCPACLSAILKSNGFWQVTKLQTQHNHELDPNMSRFMRAHSSIPSAIKRRLEAHDIAGIRPSKSVRLLEVQAGGSEKLSCLPRDYRNFINISRRRKLGNGDAGCINRMFLRMQQQNTNFFHLIDIDEDQRLTNVFWVHSRSIAAYEEFCDVIRVDTTCLINRYRMPFASIIGVNHHDQSILLGSALISHKDAKTFRWVFSTWLAAMCGGAPNAILTDQCESMKSTIREVMPNTTHRFCIWHILCKVPEKLRRVQEYDKASKEFIALIYDSLSPTMFERNCHEFVVKYNLEGNEWLLKLYNERQFWFPVYVNHIF
ncbi:hypothetical protein GH714_016436 [Hevea brasiliensis]|uniref:Uncharacterized protein n=1 Tax=Hevea brasiliensis TaxID=3981 RepID=A0A6A6M1T7_HEVBR|nr:hypothetical protein GH714_016436 [Hevea brasiliensis]